MAQIGHYHLAATAGILALTTLAVLFTHHWTAGVAGYPAITGCLNLIEIAFDLMDATWIVFYLCFVWAHFAGLIAVSSGADRADIRLKRTRWTAQLALALPACFYLVLTLAGWAGVLKLVTVALPGQENVPAAECQTSSVACPQVPLLGPGDKPCKGKDCPPVRYQRIARLPWEGRNGDVLYASDWAKSRLRGLGIAFLAVLLVVMGAGVLCIAWALLPSVIDEMSPPASEAAPGDKARDARRLSRESAALGLWMDRGLRFLRVPGEALYGTVLLAPFLAYFVSHFYKDQPELTTFSEVLGTIVAGTAVGILGFGGRLKQLALGFRPVVRVMLDVDNWLREQPRETNPTARICGRYVSILRCVLAWKDQAGKPYDAIVIVAHSQGVVITADLLRFLNAQMKHKDFERNDPELAPLKVRETPVYLFTMGAPLAQLYGLRFPFLYGWAREMNAPEKREVPDIDCDQKPQPKKLGVKMWVNAYRSGDYIGRALWRPGSYESVYEPFATRYDETWDPPAGKPRRVSADAKGTRIEFCVGAGAHTHYWDRSAILVAEVLDRLIVAPVSTTAGTVEIGDAPAVHVQ